MTEEKRGSNGGNARREKLSPEKRKAIAKLAAQKRWAKQKNETVPSIAISSGGPGTTASVVVHMGNENITPVNLLDPSPSPEDRKIEVSSGRHCPACRLGQSLEEGEGEHILATVEHPVTLPPAFDDSTSQPVAQTAPAPPPKAQKTKPKNVPKEFKSASSYAEKRLPQAIKEKSEHVAKVAQLDAEINDLVRVIKALGGSVDSYAMSAPYPAPPYSQPFPLPPTYPEYQVQAGAPPTSGASPQVPQLQPPKPMRAGGAGALDFAGIMTD